MTALPTGRLERRAGQDVVAYTREFVAPIDHVWASVTEPARLERWIGTWTGDPSSGSVLFTMTAEGDDVPAAPCGITACAAPTLLGVHVEDDSGSWRLFVELTQDGGVTTLTLFQVVTDPASLASTGPGWDYYLDRLVAAETNLDVESVDFERDYYPALSEHYEMIAAAVTSPR